MRGSRGDGTDVSFLKRHFTFTFEALLVEAPEQTATVVTESGALVVMLLEAMRHVDLEALLLELQARRDPLKHAGSWSYGNTV